MRLPASVIKILSDRFRYVAGAIAALLLVASYFLILSGKIEAVRTSGWQEQAKIRLELTTQKKYLADLQDSVAKFQQALPPDRLKEVSNLLPPQPDFPSLLLTLQNVARAANLELDKMTLEGIGAGAESGTGSNQTTSTLAPGVQSQSIQVSVSGGTSYETFKRFLALLETSQRLFDVQSVVFSHEQTTNTSAGTTYQVTLTTYYAPGAGA